MLQLRVSSLLSHANSAVKLLKMRMATGSKNELVQVIFVLLAKAASICSDQPMHLQSHKSLPCSHTESMGVEGLNQT